MSAANDPRGEDAVTAAVLVIGDEILSGRTKDKNIGFIADYLTALGIDLMEVRVVPDIEDRIVAALNALRADYTYVFTTGGIGPTHDDITADAVAKAFAVPIGVDPRAVAMMRERYSDADLTPARLRMARIPAGAELIANPVSKAPGFRIGNVHVMAGVPSIMQAMMDSLAPTLKTGRRMLSETIEAGVGEGAIAEAFAAIAAANPDTILGSYPFHDGTRFSTRLVVRARDPERLAAVAAEVTAMVAALPSKP
ncbi:competence/damage-inducible protein A [Segnochrobactrum spirostomi]|uniref:Competence/damage-inducible protein A n=1 Tax=Segnochrobactrum spirostomi TaxID=2608987 RepID=A0A6A7Y0X0_9HYPH|nr:molybdopterin-binding protein [Segnochrobactrum spirostomi]MQT11579.1 competence/damage-inducible protein A [Segnochrobactrum spirostomi]